MISDEEHGTSYATCPDDIKATAERLVKSYGSGGKEDALLVGAIAGALFFERRSALAAKLETLGETK